MKKINLFFLLSFLIVFIPSSNIYAADDEADTIITNIIIKGNNRVTNNTILSYANINKGDLFNEKLVQQVIKRLYETKYFDDISVSLNFNDLLITVKEKPIISEIVLTENQIVEDDDILSALDDVGISRTRPYDKNIFDKIEQELIRLYFDRGRYNASIETKVIPLERNRVSLELVIKEGEPSTIKEIIIVGNKAYSNKKLLSLIDSGTKYFFEFWSSKDTYSSSGLRSDIG